MKKLLPLVLTAVFIAACGPTPTPTPNVSATTAIAKSIVATMTAQAPTATPTPAATSTPSLTPTLLPSPTPRATPTPTATPTPPDTPTPTSMPTPTDTPTSAVTPTATPAPLFEGDPQAFVLTIADMPPGFSTNAENTGPTSNEYIASTRANPEEALVQLQEWGRIIGYQAAYAKSGLDALVGTAMVQNWVSIFQTSDGAHAYLGNIEDAYSEDGLTLDHTSMPALADESKAYKIVRTTGKGESQLEWITYFIVFRKHNVVAGVLTTATSGTAVFDDALNFAQTVESRIQ